MENQNQQLTVKAQKQLEAIAKAGNVSEIAFAKNTIDFVKIKNMNVVDVRNCLAMIFVKVSNLAGIKEPITDINKNDIREMVLTKFSNLSVEEIDFAFKADRYSGGPVQHYQLFNAEYVAKVLKKYQDWLAEKRRANNLQIFKEEQKQEVSTEERKEIRKQFLKNVFTEIKQSGHSNDAWLIYDDLTALNKIVVGDSRKKEMYTQESLKYTHSLKAKEFSKDIKTKIEKIANSNKNAIIVNRCKSILVAEYVIEDEVSFDEFYKLLKC